MDTNSFIIYVETDDFYKDISNDIDKWFDTSSYSKNIDILLEKGKNKKVVGKFKNDLGCLVMSEFCAPRAKTYAFLIHGCADIDYEKCEIINKKAKGTKKCVIKNNITFHDCYNVLFNDTKLIKSQFGFRRKNHEVHTEEINKIALSSNDDKRIQHADKITTYPYGYYDISEITVDNSHNTVNVEIIQDPTANIKYIDEIFVDDENIDDTNVNTKNIDDPHVNNENMKHIEVNVDTNSTFIDNNVTYDEIIDTNNANANIINDISDNYGDMPVNNENIKNTKELANFIKPL